VKCIAQKMIEILVNLFEFLASLLIDMKHRKISMVFTHLKIGTPNIFVFQKIHTFC